MRGLTKLIDYNLVVIKVFQQPIELQIGEVVEVEQAPEGKPLLTKYRIEKKRKIITLVGEVMIEYFVNQLDNGTEQKFFL